MTKWGGVTNEKMFAFGGVEVQFPIFGTAGADVKGVLENIMAVRWQAVGQVIDVDDKQYRAYDRALGHTTYGLSHLG